MPRKQRQASAVGPYDLSTIQLPFGSEFDALETGFARERASREGYTQADIISNQQLLADTRNSYVVVDLDSPHKQLARAMTQQAVFTQYHTDIMKTLPKTHLSKLNHDIMREMGFLEGRVLMLVYQANTYTNQARMYT